MKKILSLLSVINFIIIGTSVAVSCDAKKENNHDALKAESQTLKKINTELKAENEALKFFKNKSVNFITSIKVKEIKATDIEKVKESELSIAVKPEILELLKERESSLTEDDFNLSYPDYFLFKKPSFIDLSTGKIIKVRILGKGNLEGDVTVEAEIPVATSL